jgi:hypothetical protein
MPGSGEKIDANSAVPSSLSFIGRAVLQENAWVAVLVPPELEFVPVSVIEEKGGDILSTTDRGIVPPAFVAIVPIPVHRPDHSGTEERGRAIAPGPRSGLGP